MTKSLKCGKIRDVLSLMIGICISLVVKFRFELDCDDESIPHYSRRLIIRTFMGKAKSSLNRDFLTSMVPIRIY